MHSTPSLVFKMNVLSHLYCVATIVSNHSVYLSRLPTVWDGNNAKLSTEIYQKESSSTQKVVFSRYDVAELDALLAPGTFMDAYFSLDPYDFQQNAGIRLVAKKLVRHSS